MKREDLRIGQLVSVTIVGKVESIGCRVGIQELGNNRPFDVNDAEVKAEFVEPFEPDKMDEEANANGK